MAGATGWIPAPGEAVDEVTEASLRDSEADAIRLVIRVGLVGATRRGDQGESIFLCDHNQQPRVPRVPKPLTYIGCGVGRGDDGR